MKVSMTQVGPIGTNCYILEDEAAHQAAVIDPGGDAPRPAEGLERRVDAAGDVAFPVFLGGAHVQQHGAGDGAVFLDALIDIGALQKVKKSHGGAPLTAWPESGPWGGPRRPGW